ncbi:hypothetical protein C8J57DRAFT_48290 [Mycena rebaudengoi]|nr:hypothetical protein C8J57DRAFT_48290 [Mycena rebaudengoi]
MDCLPTLERAYPRNQNQSANVNHLPQPGAYRTVWRNEEFWDKTADRDVDDVDFNPKLSREMFNRSDSSSGSSTHTTLSRSSTYTSDSESTLCDDIGGEALLSAGSDLPFRNMGELLEFVKRIFESVQTHMKDDREDLANKRLYAILVEEPAAPTKYPPPCLLDFRVGCDPHEAHETTTLIMHDLGVMLRHLLLLLLRLTSTTFAAPAQNKRSKSKCRSKSKSKSVLKLERRQHRALHALADYMVCAQLDADDMSNVLERVAGVQRGEVKDVEVDDEAAHFDLGLLQNGYDSERGYDSSGSEATRPESTRPKRGRAVSPWWMVLNLKRGEQRRARSVQAV